MPDVMEDIDEVLNLLAVAPLVRSGIMPDKPIGEWNRRIVAASLLETVNAHARTLVGLLLQDHPVTPASPDDIARLAQDLLDRFNRTASVALGREDGRGLTSEWMLYLAREIAHASWAVTLVPERIALHAVAQRLVAQGMTEETLQRMIIPLRVGVPGVDVLLALSIVSYERDQGVIANLPETERAPAVAPGNTLLLNMFTELLNHGDPDLSYHRNASPPSWSHAFMGLLFVRTIDPRRAWQAAWIRLAEQRRKMYHIRYGQDSPVDEPSLFVLYAGIAAVQWLQAAQEEASGAAALQVWDCMYDAGLSVTLRLGTYHKRWSSADEWRRAVLMLTAILPHVMRHGAENARSNERLDTLLRRLGGDDELLVQSVSLLYRNGIPITEMRAAVSRAVIDLGQAVVRYASIIEDQRFVSALYRQSNPIEDCRAVLGDSSD